MNDQKHTDKPGIDGQTFTIQLEAGWFNKTGFFISFEPEGTDHIIDRMVDWYNTQSLT